MPCFERRTARSWKVSTVALLKAYFLSLFSYFAFRRCSSNQVIAWINACFLAYTSAFEVTALLTANPWCTWLYKLIWYGCPFFFKMASALSRLAFENVSSSSAQAMLRGDWTFFNIAVVTAAGSWYWRDGLACFQWRENALRRNEHTSYESSDKGSRTSFF